MQIFKGVFFDLTVGWGHNSEVQNYAFENSGLQNFGLQNSGFKILVFKIQEFQFRAREFLKALFHYFILIVLTL